MFLWMNVFTLCIWLACDSQRHERLQRIRYWFTSNHIPFRFGCRPREASRLEAKYPRGRGQTPRGRGRGRGHNPRGRGRGQVFWPRGRGQASKGLTSLPTCNSDIINMFFLKTEILSSCRFVVLLRFVLLSFVAYFVFHLKYNCFRWLSSCSKGSLPINSKSFRWLLDCLRGLNFIILRKHEFIARNNYSREIQ